MADDNRIIIEAKLDTVTSTKLIQNDLDTISKDVRLKIENVTFDESALSGLQSKLESAAKNLKLNIPTVQMQAIPSQFAEAQKVEIKPVVQKDELDKIVENFKNELGSSFRGATRELKQVFRELSEAIAHNDADSMSASFEKLKNITRNNISEIKIYNEELKKEQEAIKEIMRLSKGSFMKIGSVELDDFKTRVGNSWQSMLSSIFGLSQAGADSKKATNFVEFEGLIGSLNDKLGREKYDASQFSDTIIQLYNKLHETIDQSSQYIESKGQTVEQFYTENIANAIQHATNKIIELNHSMSDGWVEISTDSASPITVTAKEIINLEKVVDNWKAKYKQEFADAQSVTSSWAQNAKGEITGFSVSVEKANGEVEKFNHTIVQGEDGIKGVLLTGSTGTDKGVEGILKRANTEADKLMRNLDKIKFDAFDTSSNKPIKNESNKDSISQAYENATKAAEKLRTANAETYGELYDQAKRAEQNLKNLIGSYQRLENQATKLKPKSLEIIKADQTEKINAFIGRLANLEKSGINIDNLRQKAEELRTTLSNITQSANSKQQMTDFIDSFGNLETKFKSVNSAAQNIVKALNDLNRLRNSSTLTQNSGNTDVQVQVERIDALMSGYRNLLSNVGTMSTDDVSQKLIALAQNYNVVKQRVTELQDRLKSDNAMQLFGAKVDKLRAQMKDFANSNQKAINSIKVMSNGNSFAKQWSTIKGDLDNIASLDESKLRLLTQQFQVFKQEASASNLATNRFFTSMETQLRSVIQRWVSFYAVINYIKQMTQNVIALDTAMIDLKRVTEGTSETYQNFLTNASQQAREMHTTTSALIEQAYQWAKLGYDLNQSLELSKASTIFARVADTDNATAIQDMVTAMKAFNMTAEDATLIVDKLDKVNNEFAVTAAGVGEGLQRSASALASAGNTLDQTIGMITGASEITQNVENTSNGLKILALR